MKKRSIILALPAIILIIVSFKNIKQQGGEPWRQDQLIQPFVLAAIINDPSAHQPIIYNIGFGGEIKNSIKEGPMKDSVNLLKWKKELEKLPRDTDIVIYCGCCPFEHCPNIRPAFTLLNEMGFKHQKLLNLSHNLKADWIDQNYPVQ